MRSAECGTRNDFTTLRFAHKENYMNAERPCLNAERRMQSTERAPHL